MPLLKDGHWYRSKDALTRARAMKLLGDPHVTPDGYALLILDARGVVSVPRAGKPASIERHPPALVMQAKDGHDLMQVAGRDRVGRVEFPVDALADLVPLEEYDHLPDARKDYKVYPRGMKLA